MKKLIIAAAIAAATVTAPASASASSGYLPMWQGKQAARKDVRYIVSPDRFNIACWRYSWSKVRCNWTSVSDDGIYCRGTVQERMMSYGGPYYSTVRHGKCSYS